jgi:hypothetical protein
VTPGAGWRPERFRARCSSASSGASGTNGTRRRHSTTPPIDSSSAAIASPTGSFQPPPLSCTAMSAPGSPAAYGRSPDWPRVPRFGIATGPPSPPADLSSICELAGDAAGVGSKVIQP